MREAVPSLNTEHRNDYVLTSEQSSRETSRRLVAYLVPYFIVALCSLFFRAARRRFVPIGRVVESTLRSLFWPGSDTTISTAFKLRVRERCQRLSADARLARAFIR